MPAKTLLDELDIAILVELQKECRSSLQEIAEKVGAPTSTTHYRLRRLERAEIIDGYYAKIDPIKMDIDYIASIRISINLAKGSYDKIGEELSKISGVWGVYMILGDCDFLIMTRSRDRDAFMKIIEQILKIEGIRQLNTQVIAKVMKEDPRLELSPS
ncbi:MAG: Lrp/AsnC family transcriptional regulator [Candidatus Thorarchaeota archaeon]